MTIDVWYTGGTYFAELDDLECIDYMEETTRFTAGSAKQLFQLISTLIRKEIEYQKEKDE